MEKIWKEVIGFEGRYKVSESGDVFSLPKRVAIGTRGGVVERGGITLRQYPLPNGGHLRVHLADGSGKKKPLLVHRMVALAFIPNPNGYPVINHIDANPTNNHFSNLEWCTVAHNTACCDRKRVKLTGENNGFSSLTKEIVLAMRARFAECNNSAQVAREFSILPHHAWSICNRRLWTHI